MVSIVDYRKEDGQVDWLSYRRDQIACGDVCQTCHGFIIFGSGDGPRDCGSCRSIKERDEETTHRDYIRCPHCRHLHSASDDLVDLPRLMYEEGCHEMDCDECGKVFEFRTIVEYTYESQEVKNVKDQ